MNGAGAKGGNAKVNARKASKSWNEYDREDRDEES